MLIIVVGCGEIAVAFLNLIKQHLHMKVSFKSRFSSLSAQSLPKGSAIYTSPSMKENMEFRQPYVMPGGGGMPAGSGMPGVSGAPITLEPVRMISAGDINAATMQQQHLQQQQQQARGYQYQHAPHQQQQQQHQQQQWSAAKLSQPEMMETALISQDNLPPGSLLDVYHHRITDIVGLPQSYQSMERPLTATPVSSLKVVTSMPPTSATAALATNTPNKNNPFAPGELQLKFNYENITQSLSVTVLKGANLLSLDGSGLSNPFVKVSAIWYRIIRI